jgi:ubiquinone/menaquinone biosynthesis C-methylase UbiE
MSAYIMESPWESERISAKTRSVVVRHHLDWAGLRAGQSFVDFGCATGEVACEVARLDSRARVLGLDAHTGRRAKARAACEREGLHNVTFEAAELAAARSSGLADGTFDHAWTRFFLEYHPSPVDVVHEMARVVRPGGVVTLIDITGNCVCHHGMDDALRHELDEFMGDVAATGFDPYAGRKLAGYARAAGLVDVRESVEPHHFVVGTPDPRTAAEWRVKVETIRDNYVRRLFPHKAHKARFFDAFLDFILRPDTMTWSVLHLVQGRKPELGARSI